MKAVLFGVALGVVSAGVLIATLVATSYLAAAAPFVLGFLGIAVADVVFMRARLGKSASRSRSRARGAGVKLSPDPSPTPLDARTRAALAVVARRFTDSELTKIADATRAAIASATRKIKMGRFADEREAAASLGFLSPAKIEKTRDFRALAAALASLGLLTRQRRSSAGAGVAQAMIEDFMTGKDVADT
jgi:hypothetical protein